MIDTLTLTIPRFAAGHDVVVHHHHIGRSAATNEDKENVITGVTEAEAAAEPAASSPVLRFATHDCRRNV